MHTGTTSKKLDGAIACSQFLAEVLGKVPVLSELPIKRHIPNKAQRTKSPYIMLVGFGLILTDAHHPSVVLSTILRRADIPSHKLQPFMSLSCFEPNPLPASLFSLSSSIGNPRLGDPCYFNDEHGPVRPMETLSSLARASPTTSSSTPPQLLASRNYYDHAESSSDDDVCWTAGAQFQHIDLDLNRIKIEPLRSFRTASPCLSSPPRKNEESAKQEDCIMMNKHSKIKQQEEEKNNSCESPAASGRRWTDRYDELVTYKRRFGTCCVPSQWVENPPLAQWVKRQRYQLRLRNEGERSTMSSEREELLNQLDFTWDPHSAFWEERLIVLEKFLETHGHANVPTKYPENPQLAIWAKCQRRQMKLYVNDGPDKSNMTRDRMEKLNRLGFVFDPRGQRTARSKSKSSSLPDLRIMLMTAKRKQQRMDPQHHQQCQQQQQQQYQQHGMSSLSKQVMDLSAQRNTSFQSI